MAVRAPSLQSVLINDFSGGVNLRDAPSQIAPNESPNCHDVTLDQRGAVLKRLGMRADNSSDIAAANGQAMHYSSSLGQMVMQFGAELWRRTGADAYSEMERSGSVNAFTTAATCDMVDFAGTLYIIHPADGVLKWDGANIAVVTASVKGVALAVWQNKVWAAGPWSDNSNATRVWWSNAGDGDAWTTASDFVDVRDLNDDPITALGNGQMLDQAGAGTPERSSGLLVYKEQGVYRISDSTTGEYATLSGDAGASNARSVCSLVGAVAFVNHRGIWMTDGLNPPIHVSDKVRPLFTHEALSTTAGVFAAGTYRDRMFFSIRRAGATENDLTLEFDPDSGWLVPHRFGFTAWDQFPDGQPYALRSSNKSLYRMFTGGTDWAESDGDNGTDIHGHYQTAWFNLAQHNLVRFRRVRISGRGQLQLFVLHNYGTAEATVYSIDLESNAMADWGGGDNENWGEGQLWGPTALEMFEDRYSQGIGYSISFHVHNDDGLSSTTPSLLGDGASLEIGSFQLRSLKLDFVNLAYA